MPPYSGPLDPKKVLEVARAIHAQSPYLISNGELERDYLMPEVTFFIKRFSAECFDLIWEHFTGSERHRQYTLTMLIHIRDTRQQRDFSEDLIRCLTIVPDELKEIDDRYLGSVYLAITRGVEAASEKYPNLSIEQKTALFRFVYALTHTELADDGDHGEGMVTVRNTRTSRYFALSDPEMESFVIDNADKVDAILNVIENRCTKDTGVIAAALELPNSLQSGVL